MTLQPKIINRWIDVFTESMDDIFVVFVNTALKNINIGAHPAFLQYTPTTNVSDMYNKADFPLFSASDMEIILGEFVKDLQEYSPTRKLIDYHSTGRSIVDFAFSCLHPFFMPARVSADLSKDFKLQFLTRWVTIMMTLPFQQQFINNFSNSCMPDYIEGYNFIMSQMGNGGKLQITPNACATIFNARKQNNSLKAKFVKGYCVIVLLLSKIIITFFNPYHKKLAEEFPSYTTTQWIHPADVMHREQMIRINKILGSLTMR